jgi:translation initiation factor IF-1
MSKADAIESNGTVTESLPNAMFKVQLDDNKAVITCTLSGKMRQNNIRVLLGDYVSVEMSTYDLSKGRITYRHKKAMAAKI